MTVDEREIEAATAAVVAANELTASAQGRLLSGDMLTKSDESPVTVADFAAQAIACAVLADALGDVVVVGEEDPDELTDRPDLIDGVAALVSESLGRPVNACSVLGWIGLGTGVPQGDRYWTLDPIDGTKGFLRGDQYAIALALIERGEVVLGVLGCPNYPITAATQRGMTLVAANGETQEIVGDRRRRIVTSDPSSLNVARFCESVESGHSDHSQSAAIAARLAITSDPFRIDSQCKYGAIARGDADIYLRLPTRADYRERIWDHAAGLAVVTSAGGRVTDIRGNPLDFSAGARLAPGAGVIASSGRYHEDVVAAVVAVVDGDDDGAMAPPATA